jgi:hypothetical protein
VSPKNQRQREDRQKDTGFSPVFGTEQADGGYGGEERIRDEDQRRDKAVELIDRGGMQFVAPASDQREVEQGDG